MTSTEVEKETAVLLRDKYLLKGLGGIQQEVRWDSDVLCEVYRRLLLVYDDNYATTTTAGGGGGDTAAGGGAGETTTKALARTYKYVTFLIKPSICSDYLNWYLNFCR